MSFLLVGSLAAHVLLPVAMWFGADLFRRRPQLSRQDAITTRLVKLGKKREEHLLPRKEAPPPPAAKEAPAIAPPEAQPKPVAKPKESAPKPKTPTAKERVESMSKVSGALDRLKKISRTEPEGDPDGVADGDVTDAALAVMGSKYATEIYKCVKRFYSVEGLDPSKVVGRQASVLVRVQADGSFSDIAIAESSGLEMFDRAVERAVRRCHKVSPPPEHLREQVVKDGVEFRFKP